MSPLLLTIGHSTRTIGEFIEFLQSHRVQLLIDVRRFPASKRYPHFNSEVLAKSLAKIEVVYKHSPCLGGRRKARPDSANLGWRNESFRGYADYMQTDEFRKALEELMADSRSQLTAMMCAEAVPWRCHRSLIADAVTTRGWIVRHILNKESLHLHSLTEFAVVDHGLLTYPASDASSRLF